MILKNCVRSKEIMRIRTLIRDYLSLFCWNFGGYHRAEEKMTQEYYTDTPATSSKRQVIFMIDGRQKHGGLADRFRSICTIYRWCKENGAEFKLNYSNPFRLEDYLESNEVDWICKDGIDYSQNASRPVILFDYLLPMKYHKKYLDLLLKWSKKSLHIYTYTFFNIKTYGADFRTLFKPAPRLQQQIDYHTEKIGKPYTAVVTRFQQLLGDFKEGDFKILSEPDQQELIARCIRKVKELHKDGEMILCTSDSYTFLQEVSKLDFVYTMPGKVVHIDYNDGANYDTYLKSFLDFYMIAGAQMTHLLQTGDMYRSGFPGAAAIAGDKPWDIIVFDDNNEEIIHGGI